MYVVFVPNITPSLHPLASCMAQCLTIVLAQPNSLWQVDEKDL